jgi:hypothetical protein
VKRALVAGVATAIVLAAPGSAAAKVEVNFTKWVVVTANGKSHKLDEHETFVRCAGTRVKRLKAVVSYQGVKPGKSYTEEWDRDGNAVARKSYTWGKDHGKLKPFLYRKPGKFLNNGKYQLQFQQGGKGVGKSWVRIKQSSSC